MSEGLVRTDEPIVDNFDTEALRLENSRLNVDRLLTIARLELLWARRRFLFKVLIYGLLASVTLSFVIPPRYESTVQLMPPEEQSAGLAALTSLATRSTGTGALAGLASDLLGQKTSGDVFVGVLGSRTVRTALVTKFDLRKVYGKKLWEDAGKVLSKRTEITRDKKSGIITITVSDRSPQRAADMAMEYIQQLNWVTTQLNTSSAHRERIFLEDRLGQVGQALEKSEKNFSNFASKNTAIDIPQQGKAMVEAASALEGQLIAAQTELQGVKEIYSDGNVRVLAIRARIAELQRQIGKVGGDADSADGLGASGSDSLYPSLRKLPLLGVQYADLLRDTKVQEAVFEVLTQEYELSKVSEAKETPSVVVLDSANVAEKKSFPPRKIITALGTCIALAGGMFWILFLERWGRMDPQDPMKSFLTRVYVDARHSWPRNSPNGVGTVGHNGQRPDVRTLEP